MDPHKLASRQIGINEVETALKSWNVNLPTGTIVGPQRAFVLMASGQLMSAAQYRPLIVAYRNGSPVRLEELGTVIDGWRTIRRHPGSTIAAAINAPWCWQSSPAWDQYH